MPKRLRINIEKLAGSGYQAKAEDLSVFADGETVDEIVDNIIEAVKCHFTSEERPEIIILCFDDHQEEIIL